MDQRTIGRTIAGALALLAAVGVAVGWRRKGNLGLRRSGGGDPAGEPWSCECGQRYRVSGQGRHRIYWVAGASHDDPVLRTVCVSCERSLPAGAGHP